MNNLPSCTNYTDTYVDKNDCKKNTSFGPPTRFTKKVCQNDDGTFGYQCVYEYK